MYEAEVENESIESCVLLNYTEIISLTASVLVLAWIELIIFRVAGIVLWFGFSMRIMITH